MKNLTHTNIINEILENVRDDMEDEEIIHLVLEKKVSNLNNDSTTSEKLADKIAKITGSWAFIIIFIISLLAWMLYNLLAINRFDPYPYILLNLILSCIAAIQAPIIMMSQNRQEEKDRQRNINDYKVNLKTEIIIQDLHNKLDLIIEELQKVNDQL